MATKKVRRRRRNSSKRKPTKLYFNQKTQESIIEYQNEESLTRRQQIYVEGILPAFDKLVENLIFIHGFTKSFGAGSYESLKGDCVSFLYESIHKWNPERGTKAFSYFNVVAKNLFWDSFSNITIRPFFVFTRLYFELVRGIFISLYSLFNDYLGFWILACLQTR